ncbi:MAG TPA: hypothetical protein PKA62_05530 [Thermoanaerobaculia bacterium]|nr:hypothetical protein [Thermoanaerobaculia bacterium]
MGARTPADRLLEILAEKIVEETGLDPPLAREVAPSALAADSVDESRPIELRDARGHVVARVPFALVEEAFDDLDDEEDGAT